MIKRILMGIGGTPFTKVAIERAVGLADLHGARLTAVTVVDPDNVCNFGPVPAGAGIYAKRLCDKRTTVTRNHIDEAVAAFEKSCRHAGVEYTVAYETGDPFELMISHARYHDLIIFGVRSIFDYQLAEEPEKDLIRLLSQGVRPILAVSSRIRSIRKVMVAYSGSMESAKAMRHFVQFKLWPDAALVIVRFSSNPGAGEGPLKDAAAYCRDHGYEVETRVIPGNARDHLLSGAGDLNADMIVMGNSIRSIWLRKVLGDTVLKALTRADCPIFLSQ